MSQSPSKTRAISRIPQEIWDSVARKVSPIGLGHASRILRFKISPEQEPITNLWKTIFKDEIWLNKAIEAGTGKADWQKSNPALVGRDLDKLLNGNHSGKGCYLVLVAHNGALGDLRDENLQLMRSLMPQIFYVGTEEVKFTNGLTLNIGNVYSGGEELMPVRLDKLFEYRDGRLQTSYLNYLDERPAIRHVGPEGIVGMGGQATKLNKVKRVCGITLTLPGGGRHQHIFKKRGRQLDHITAIGNTRFNEFAGWTRSEYR